MGQRHQVITVFRKGPGSGGGPPNRYPSLEGAPLMANVMHLQWLYGGLAIRALHRVLQLAHNQKKGEDLFALRRGDYGLHGDYDGVGWGFQYPLATKAIAAAYSVDPPSGEYRHVAIWGGPDSNDDANDSRYKTPGAANYEVAELAPGDFDNNDGITLLRWEGGEELPGYAFLTPNHLEGRGWNLEQHGCGPWTAAQYFDFYRPSLTDATYLATCEAAIEDINKMGRFMEREEVQALLPLFELPLPAAQATANSSLPQPAAQAAASSTAE